MLLLKNHRGDLESTFKVVRKVVALKVHFTEVVAFKFVASKVSPR